MCLVLTRRAVWSENLADLTFRARVAHWIGLDRAIFFTVLARFWAAFAGLFTVFLIARFLTPGEQGYYYTFFSVVALQVVFELGFSFVVLQLAAHERAALSFYPHGRIEGDPIAHSRLASVLKKSIGWYSVAAILMTAALLPAGYGFFGLHHLNSTANWKAPWIALVISSMLAFQLDPIFSFLEGCGFIVQVARRRAAQSVAGSLLAWMAIITHHGLFAPAMMILGSVLIGFAFLLTPTLRPLLVGLIRHPSFAHQIGWRSEIWPFQWKIAVSWLCGYAIYQLFNPVLFAYQGPVAAGRMGMSLSVANGLGTVAIAWMNTKASPFGAMVASKNFAELDRVFFRTLWQSTCLLAVGAASVLLFLLLAGSHFPKFGARLVPPWVLGLLLLSTIFNHIVGSQALYLRAHKQEPFLWPTVISATLLGCLTYFLGKYSGVNAVVVGMFAQGVTFSLPVATWVFMTKRRQWHGDLFSPKCQSQSAYSHEL